MKRILATSLIAVLALSTACGQKKVEDKAEEQGQAAKDEQSGDAATDPNAPKTDVPAQKLTDLYPPAIGVYPLSAPAPGRSLFFGFSSDGTQKFEMIWVYAVAAVPDFDKAVTVPQFTTQAEFDAFMEKWATEFKDRPEMVAALTKLQTEFSFKVDPLFMTDAAVTIPAAALDGQPNYVKITQKFYARRYTTKQAGATTISATANGATLSVPVTVTAYTNASITAGKTRYDTAANAATPGLSGCVGCHGSATAGQDAFLKHSSDYLAYATDAEILAIVKTGTYPDSTLMANAATHKFTFAAVTDEANIVGYLRSFPPSFDKLQGVAAQPAALRLR
ncbi:MAG TPA: hypothetical protein VE954_25080 [Oligoflexus sp.]|uniref:hypothetical protein n=1 Tax=Oligoflexus sp. TaxID=1971216 RepID=UPI002D66F43E|nr:hypothetical protein [Oligoflexus sp.]HYX36393.1 hypothetical protein [Oligoflexus sp.]